MMTRSSTRAAIALPVLLLAMLAVPACGRNDVPEQRSPGAGSQPPMVRQLPLVPGDAPRTQPVAANPFDGDTVALADGERLYGWFNCSGCHFGGGGGIGPPLMDRAWVYGGDPHQIFDSIASGRANGMPAFGDKITTDQIWKITLYVQKLAADAAEQESSGGSARNAS